MRLRWLGQAGFVVPSGDHTIVIDPYLSDSLAEKYAGTLFEHDRAYPPPVDPNELRCDLVICTHRHTDHMDGQTLRALVAANPELRVCVPRAVVDHALGLELPADRLVAMSAGTPFEPLPGVTVTPVPAAHEELSIDAHGEHRFLGVVLALDGVSVYHSGDCVPYDGQVETLRSVGVDVALLPVNGRDAYRLRHGVPGNFFIDEAIELCGEVGAGTLVGHHVGLFDFNTVAPDRLDRAVDQSGTDLRWIRPDVGAWFEV